MKFSFARLSITSLLVATLALTTNLFGQEESLPQPIIPGKAPAVRTPLVDTSSVSEYRRNRMEIEAANRAIRIERARRLSEAQTDLQIAQMYSGYQPARPTVNAGFMFNAPPAHSYRSINMYRPIYAW